MKVSISKETLNQIIVNENKCIDCKRCFNPCPMMKEYALSPKELMKDIISNGNVNKNIPYSCMLCGACDNKCPKDIDVKNMFYNIRKDILKNNKKELKDIGYNTIKLHQINSFSPVFSSSRKDINSKKIFLPGCSLSSYNTELINNTFKYLKKNLGNISLVMQCCGKPTEAMGDMGKFKEYYSKLENMLREENIDEVIVACPNCLKTIRKHSKNIKVTPIWELITKFGIPNELVNHYSNLGISFTLHDPCPIRNERSIHEDVRNILSSLGTNIVEYEKNRESSECCGSGAMVRVTNPDISNKQTNKRANDAKTDTVVSYCQSCCESMLIANKKTLHVLDFIFNKEVINKRTFSQQKTSTIEKWSNRYKSKKITTRNR